MAGGFTRRTHVVRIHDEVNNNGSFVDVEVLDAVSFKTDQGKEMVLNMPAEKAIPFIVDDTGDGSAQSPSNGTRRSHMKRIKGDADNFFDVEVLDCVAFNGENGQQWILNLPAERSDPFNTTDNSGSRSSTRRTHTEKVGSSGASKDADGVTIERCDMMAFRTTNGQEVIVKMPSFDDGTGDRASTKMTPDGYDPAKADSPTPPDNKDPHVYIKFVKDGGVLTGKTLIQQGPLWWIRKIGTGGIVFVTVNYSLFSKSGPPSRPTMTLFDMPFTGGDSWDILGKVDQLLPGATPTAIANPVTDAMMTSYAMWTPQPLVEETQKGIDDANTIFYVDSGPRLINGDILTPLPTKENYLDIFRGPTGIPVFGIPGDLDSGATIIQARDGVAFSGIDDGDPDSPDHLAKKNGFDLSRLANFSNIYGNRADCQYVVDAANSLNGSAPAGVSFDTVSVGEIELSAGGKAFLRKGQAVFAINYGQLKSAWATKKPPNHPITFSVRAESGAESIFFQIDAQVYKKNRDFPLDANNIPQVFDPEWKPDGASAVFSGAVFVGTIVVDPDDKKKFKINFSVT